MINRISKFVLIVMLIGMVIALIGAPVLILTGNWWVGAIGLSILYSAFVVILCCFAFDLARNY